MSIVITGATGFIGYNVAKFLNDAGHTNLILVDRIKRDERLKNLQYETYLDANDLPEALEKFSCEAVIHLGASVNTGDTDRIAIFENNFEYSKKLFDYCAQMGIRFIYASSAATYGDGSKGFDDQERELRPQNFYAESKYAFDEYALQTSKKPPQWVGLKFFNVYGPHEGHKGRMASTVLFSYDQAKREGVIKLFRSHNPEFKDGEQARDFIFVKDIAKVISFFLIHPERSGIFNLGTGEARTFKDLAYAVFAALGKEPKIEFVDTPEQFRKQYQYFTEANMRHLREVGYTEPFTTLEQGVKEYVQKYLETGTSLA
jgi:ADP-L-glycero-D-manno-heptose 6-epimerase